MNGNITVESSVHGPFYAMLPKVGVSAHTLYVVILNVVWQSQGSLKKCITLWLQWLDWFLRSAIGIS